MKAGANENKVILDPDFPCLKQHIIKATGLVYYLKRDLELAEKIQRRISVLGLRDCSSYFVVLKSESELDTLVTELTIGETYFFRHREQFDALRNHVIPDLIEKNRGTRHLRIWSAGCSIGAEPYSIAILLKEHFAADLIGWDVSILGTDINRDFLARAETGRFDEWAFRMTEQSLRELHFTRLGNSWLIEPELRKAVVFQYHNLLKHPFPSLINNLAALDLIVCRNVMIYFDADTSRKVMSHFEESLIDGGWLLLGHAEQLSSFGPVLKGIQFPNTLVYQKVSGTLEAPLPRPSAEPQPWSLPLFDDALAPKGLNGRQEPIVEISDVRKLADRGDFARAVALCERFIEQCKLDPIGYFYYALVLEQIGRHIEAEQVLRRVIQTDRSFALGHYYLGLFYQRRKEPDKARRCFHDAEETLSGKPDDEVFADGDGITVRELRRLIQTYLRIQ